MAVKLTHPDSKAKVTVNAEDVAMYESQGWETSPHANVPKDDDK